jgi:CSLREA domain-containing protein
MARTRLLVGLIALLAVGSQAFAISAAERAGLALDATGAADPSRTTAITFRLPRQVAAVDGRLYFDASSAIAVGVAPVGGGRAFAPVDISGGIAFGAYNLRPTGNAVLLRVVLVPTRPGRLAYRLAIDAAADSAGRGMSISGARAARGELSVRGSSRLREAPAARSRPQPLRAAGPTRDVVADGRANLKDLDVVRSGWELSRLNEQQCGATEYAEADANGDGCVDIIDVQAVSAAQRQRGDAADGDRTATATQPLLASAAGSLVSDVGTAAAPSLTFVVNSTADTPDASYGDKVCADSQGRCTLRAALTEANWNSGPDRIEFNLSGNAPVRIQLSSTPMPVIHDRSGGVTIDGYSQPGARVNTATAGSNAILGVELVGTSGSPRGNALRVTSGGNTIRGLLFRNFYRPFVFDGADSRNNRFVGNWIGFDADGDTSSYSPNVGVLVDRASDNFIGSPALADVNVIGNATKAIFLSGPGADRNVVQNSFFCMTPSGFSTATCQTAIDADFGPKHNVIGGLGARERNVFGRTTLNGIELSHGWNPDGPTPTTRGTSTTTASSATGSASAATAATVPASARRTATPATTATPSTCTTARTTTSSRTTGSAPSTTASRRCSPTPPATSSATTSSASRRWASPPHSPTGAWWSWRTRAATLSRATSSATPATAALA